MSARPGPLKAACVLFMLVAVACLAPSARAQCAFDPSDTNCDGTVDLRDVDPFMDILLNGGAGCSACTGDCNLDGVVNFFDIECFENDLCGGGPTCGIIECPDVELGQTATFRARGCPVFGGSCEWSFSPPEAVEVVSVGDREITVRGVAPSVELGEITVSMVYTFPDLTSCTDECQFTIDGGPPPCDDPTPMPKSLPMQYGVWEAEQLALQWGLGSPELRMELDDRGVEYRDDPDVLRVFVEIVGPDGADAVSEGLVLSVGGDALDDQAVWEHRRECYIPVHRLIELAGLLDPGYTLLLPQTPWQNELAGEGPAVTYTAGYQTSGMRGKDSKIAVVDTGFSSLSTARGSIDAPSAAQTTAKDFTPGGTDNIEDITNHGTRCVEVLYDFASEATYYLLQARTLTEFGQAVDYAISQNVHFISFSGGFTTTGWADDSGDACKAANKAADAGILFFTAAGNEAQRHHQSRFSDPDNDCWHEFANGSELLSVVLQFGDRLTAAMQWDADAAAGTDYDLYLYRYNYDQKRWDADRIAASGKTFETLTWKAKRNETVHLCVKKIGGGDVDFEVFTNIGEWASQIVPEGSTCSPSNSTRLSVICVGAVDQAKYLGPNNNPIESFSGRGPSNGGITSVTLAGPDRISTSTGGGPFGGTSCAVPATVGVAAMIKSGKPSLSTQQIRGKLFEWAVAFHDWGAAGLDQTYGYGGVLVPQIRVKAAAGSAVIKLKPAGTTDAEFVLYGAPTLDVQNAIDESKVVLAAGNIAQAARQSTTFRDVDGDERADAVYKFKLPADFPSGKRYLTLRGEFANGGFPWAGDDLVTVTPPPGPNGNPVQKQP